MSGELCLKWNNHTSSFIRILETLRSKELYCDVTLVCSGKFYPTHRFVLSTCSEYFEEIFVRASCKHPFVILKDIDSLELESILNYMYNGQVNVLQENLPDFIKAAEILQIKGLAVPDDDNFESDKRKDDKQPSELQSVQVDNLVTIESESSYNNADENETVDENGDIDNDSSVILKCKLSKREKVDGENPVSKELKKKCVEYDNSQDIEDQAVEVKNEPDDLTDPLETDYEISGFEIADAQIFTSLIDSSLSQEHPSLAIEEGSDNLVMPQCSSWDFNRETTDKMTGEVQAPWPQSNDEFNAISLETLPSFSVSAMEDIIGDSEEGQRTSKTTLAERQFKHFCNECSYKSNDRAALRVHVMRRHTGERPFTCSFCDYSCTTRDMLKIHTRKHTGERPFGCPYCSARMAVKSRLKRHIILQHMRPPKPRNQSDISPIVINTDTPIGVLKSFKCTQCSYETQTKSHLKIHTMRIHTGERPVACSICSYRTTTKAQLDKHMFKHTGEKPYACTFCSYKAVQKRSLLKHMPLHLK